MTSEWCKGGHGLGRKINTAARRIIADIPIESRPRKGYTGYWMTLNGRVVFKKKLPKDPWKVYLDRVQVGTVERDLATSMQANEWIVKRGSKPEVKITSRDGSGFGFLLI